MGTLLGPTDSAYFEYKLAGYCISKKGISIGMDRKQPHPAYLCANDSFLAQSSPSSRAPNPPDAAPSRTKCCMKHSANFKHGIFSVQ